MESVNYIGKFYDRKLNIKVEISKHSHGYYYIHFFHECSKCGNSGIQRKRLEPDLIEDDRFINFDGRFLKIDDNKGEKNVLE